MDLKHLRYFIAVAEELHFARAAARLNMSQPPLSQMINRLEDSLGFKLFERTKRKVVLTEAGKVLLQHSRSIIARADFAVQNAERTARGDVGHLRVAFIPWADFTPLFSDVFRRFGERHPEVVVDFHSMPALAAVTALEEHRIDIAFLSTPPEPPEGLSTQSVLSDSIVLALPEKHPMAERDAISLRLLASEPQIVVAADRIGSYYQMIEAACNQAGFNLQAKHIIDHPQTTLALVSAGVGVSLVPASYENVRRPGIIYRPLETSITVRLVAAWNPEDNSRVVAAFLGILRDIAG
ncbi:MULTISPECIES: LysR substrate-binding domain-containing protein [unclassified Sinorhizobium]|uniref:LysR substrate-binding domain-containing protein n=1 Tax=unclassified Sinorhizobium TaxID=2613772 RepID=UPI00352365E3